MLPGVHQLPSEQEKQLFLQSYSLTYLKEEIWAEQIVKNLDPFRKFLEVAAQCHGKIINHLNISRNGHKNLQKQNMTNQKPDTPPTTEYVRTKKYTPEQIKAAGKYPC